MTTPDENAQLEQFLMGGGGAPDAFKRIERNTPIAVGTTVSGRIISWKMEQQRDYDDDTKLLFWKNGDPRMQLVITVQTDLREPDRYEDDEGERRFFVKGEMQKALRAALEAAGKRTIERGGTLTIQFTGTGTPKDAKSNPPNLYAAHYQPPEAAEAAAFLAADATSGHAPALAPGQAAAQVMAHPTPMQVPGQTLTLPATVVAQAPQLAQAIPTPEQAQALLAAQLGATPLAQPVAPVAPVAAPVQPAPAAAPAAPPTPGLDPAVAAALAALTPEQRAAMGLPA